MSNDLSSLEREIEETRARLSGNIDQLVYRTNPKTIVHRQVVSAQSYFVNPATGEPRSENIGKVALGVLGVVLVFAVIRKIAK